MSEFGTLHLEFSYLSDITGNPEYRNRVIGIRNRLDEIEKPNGLYPNYLNPKTGKWGQRTYYHTFGACPSAICCSVSVEFVHGSAALFLTNAFIMQITFRWAHWATATTSTC